MVWAIPRTGCQYKRVVSELACAPSFCHTLHAPPPRPQSMTMSVRCRIVPSHLHCPLPKGTLVPDCVHDTWRPALRYATTVEVVRCVSILARFPIHLSDERFDYISCSRRTHLRNSHLAMTMLSLLRLVTAALLIVPMLTSGVCGRDSGTKHVLSRREYAVCPVFSSNRPDSHTFNQGESCSVASLTRSSIHLNRGLQSVSSMGNMIRKSRGGFVL